ncbi:MAG: hypothetical protein RTU30_11215 [Candidatus Thorarchaeota archaeon]
MGSEVELIVNGEKIAMNKFVNNVLVGVVMAVLRNLHGMEELDEISKIEIS